MSANDIKNHMVWAVLSIFMFWPTGVPALLNAIKVNSAAGRGDLALAQEASVRAKKWCKISTIIWVIVMILVIVGTILGFCAMSKATSYYY